ncbi:hypothetical protein QL285_056031 [Trifolium repens]|jgi:hypothetical protein|nr:hypothetical protein QL285_056031 [Trifolium repens]
MVLGTGLRNYVPHLNLSLLCKWRWHALTGDFMLWRDKVLVVRRGSCLSASSLGSLLLVPLFVVHGFALWREVLMEGYMLVVVLVWTHIQIDLSKGF